MFPSHKFGIDAIVVMSANRMCSPFLLSSL
jgi:hypothetical protein